MKNPVGVSFLAIAGLLTSSFSLSAHHGNASYGHAKELTLKGMGLAQSPYLPQDECKG
jgi:hypothetical protein